MKIKILITALVAISINAFSQIISYNANQTIIGPGAISFDLNNDGTYDFAFQILTLSPNVLGARVVTLSSSTMLDNSTYGYPDALNTGNPVSGYFNTGFGVLGTFNNTGHFNGAGDKYLGVKINLSGNNFAGWIKLYCSTNRDTLKIISCGYNTVAFGPINAGQVSTTAVNENETMSDHSVFIYPNPSSGVITIEMDNSDGEIEIYDLTGKRIFKMEMDERKSLIDLTEFPAGIYLLQIKTAQGSFTKKLIIQK